MRHLAIHDPDAYKDHSGNYSRINDSNQLIDEEDEEEEEDSMIVPNESDEEQTLSFTLDPQTQQILQNTNGEQVVVFEVVQLNNNNADGDNTALPVDNQLLDQMNVLHTSTSKGKGKARYSFARQNGANSSNGLLKYFILNYL